MQCRPIYVTFYWYFYFLLSLPVLEEEKNSIFCVTPSSKSKTFFAHIISLCEREHRHLHCWKETLPMAFFKIEQNWMFAQKRNSLVMDNLIYVALFLRTLKLETWNFRILIFTGDACTLFLCDSAMKTKSRVWPFFS